MFIKDIMAARANLALQREAVRILNVIMENLNVTPSPDGEGYRCAFNVDVEFLDRLGVWGAAEAELEDTDTDTDGGDDMEADGRGLQPLREPSPDVPLIAQPITEPPMSLPEPMEPSEGGEPVVDALDLDEAA